MSENRFCQKDADGNYVNCIVVSDNDCGGINDPDVETKGREYLAAIGITGEWFFVEPEPEFVPPPV